MKKISAFSLIEAIVAIFLLYITFLYVFSIFPNVGKALQMSENHLSAGFISRSLIDETIKTGFDNMTSSSGLRTLSGINNGAVFSQTMNYTVTVQALNNLQKMITAVVTWNEPSGAKQVVLQTLIVKPMEGQ